MRDWINTGGVRFRQTRWLRRVVIQVEQRDSFHKHMLRWTDASLDDLQSIMPADGSTVPIHVPTLRMVK